MSKQEKLKICRTVGALITELAKLPKTAKLSDPMRPVYYNTGETAKQMGLTPQVGFEEGD
jgi:hypothetical protein